MPVPHRLPMAFILVWAVFSLPIPVHAQVFTWLYPGGNNGAGTFQTTTNWTPNGIPGSASTVRFLNNLTTTVNFSASTTTAAFIEQQGNVTLNLTGTQSYTVTGLNGFIVGNTLNQSASLTISGGGLLHLTNFNSGIATASGSNSTVHVTGSGTRFVSDFWNDVGVSGIAAIDVNSGANYQTGGFSSVGLNAGSLGQILVGLGASTFTSGQGMAIGNSGTGYIVSYGGGTVNIGANAVLGVNAGGNGTIQVGTGNPINGGTFNSNGLTIGNNGTGSVFVYTQSTLNNVGAVNIASLSGSTGQVVFGDGNGPGGTWNQSGGSIYVGGTSSGAGGTGTISLSQGGVLNVSGAGNGIVVRAGHGSVILDGGTINTPNFSGFASDYPSFSTPGLLRGTLTINGGTFLSSDGNPQGSFIMNTVTGPLTINLLNGARFSPTNLFIGGAGGNILNVNSGSVLTTSSAGTEFGSPIGFSGSTTSNTVITIDGQGSKWINNNSSEIVIGGARANVGGSATLNIQNNGLMDAPGSPISLGASQTSTGILNVNTGGSINSGSIYVGGYLDGPHGTGALFVNSGGSVNVSGSGNGITLYSGLGTLTLDGGTINTPNLTMPDTQIGNNTLLRGTININGGNFDHGNKTLFLTSNTGNLTFNLLSGATTNSLFNVFIGNAGGSNLLTVQGGSHLDTVNGSIIGYQGSTPDTATLTITGAGSSWNTHNSPIHIGSSFFSTSGGGTFNVENNAIVNAGAGIIRLGTAGAGSNGVMNIIKSSIVLSSSGEIATSPGSSGTVNIGALPGMVASAWYMTDTLAIGGSIVSAGGTGILNLNSGSITNPNSVVLWQNGRININGGILQLNSLAANGGSVQFNAGQVLFLADWIADYNQLSTLLGNNSTLGTGRTLSVSGVTTLYSDMTLDGGAFVTGSIIGGGRLHLNTGSFNLTNANLIIGSGGTLGATVNLANQMRVNLLDATNSVQINSDGRLFMSGGSLFTIPSSPGVINNGQIQLLSPLSLISGGPLTNNGLILGSGQISSNLTNNTSGTIRATGSDRIVFVGTSNVNNGNINLVGGTVEFLGQLTNGSSGAITGRGTLATSTGAPGSLGLINNGVMLFSSGNTDVYGDVQNNAGARIVTSGVGITTFYDDVVHNGTEIRTNASSRTVFFGNQSGAGNFTGTGTVEYNGDYRPGNSPANIHYEGNVVFTSTAGLFIELGGTLPGSSYDRLTIQGNVDLSSLLHLQLINGYSPNAGDSFMIIDNQGTSLINGTFSDLPEGSLFVGDGNLFQISYQGGDGNDVVLTAVPEPATWILIGVVFTGIAGCCLWRRRKHKQAQDMLIG